MDQHRIIRIRLDPSASKISILSLIISCTVFTQTARLIPDYSPLHALDMLFFLLGLPCLIAIHEVVHALAWMVAGKLPLKAFEFGIIWQGFMPYCHCKEAIKVRVYRFGALMPLIITVPAFIGLMLIWPSTWSALLAAFSLSGCLGDVWLFRKLRTMKRDDLVRDCPNEAGCDVLEKEVP